MSIISDDAACKTVMKSEICEKHKKLITIMFYFFFVSGDLEIA